MCLKVIRFYICLSSDTLAQKSKQTILPKGKSREKATFGRSTVIISI